MQRSIKLYKQDRQWKISQKANTIQITHGTISGKQQTDTINYPSIDEASKEYLSRIAYMKERRLYSETGEVTTIECMLAQTYNPSNPLPERVWLQPKLDGIRCIASNKGMFTRQHKKITSLPNIDAAISKLHDNIYLDGELYLHGGDFQKHLEIIKRDNPHPDFDKIQYCVFDVVSDVNYRERNHLIDEHLQQLNSPYIKQVPSLFGHRSSLETYLNYCIYYGYEGCMIRLNDYGYEQGIRSSSLLKYKREDTTEFKIIGWTAADKGREKDCAIAICSCSAGTFQARMLGPLEWRKSLYANPPYVNAQLTGRILHYGYTRDGFPRQPRCDSFFYGAKP